MEEKKIENINKRLALYLMENKDLRVWQNIRNFFEVPFVLTADNYDLSINQFTNIKDTFYDKE